MTVWEDCEDAHSRRTRFLHRSNPLTGRPGPHVLSSSFGLPASSRTPPLPKRSASALLTPTILICCLIYLVSQTKTVYSDGLMSPTESWTSACRAGPTRSDYK